jgi:hypothetical protein
MLVLYTKMYVKLDAMAEPASQQQEWANPYDWCEQCDMAPILKAVDKFTCKYTVRPSTIAQVEKRAETGIFKTSVENTDKIDITQVVSELADIYKEMTSVTAKLHEITSDPQYSFFEEDFYIVAKRWRELSDERQKLVTQLVGQKEISDMSQYIKELCTLSKLNAERNQCIDEITTLVSIPFQTKEDEYKTKISTLEDEIKALKHENLRLTSIISESSIHATNYARTKDEEIAHLTAKYDKLDAKYNDLLTRNNEPPVSVTSDVDELRQRLEELVGLFKNA